jgi:hypothetical protein
LPKAEHHDVRLGVPRDAKATSGTARVDEDLATARERDDLATFRCPAHESDGSDAGGVAEDAF